MIDEVKINKKIAEFILKENDVLYGLVLTISHFCEEILMKIVAQTSSTRDEIKLLNRISIALSRIKLFQSLTARKKPALGSRELKEFELLYKIWAECCVHIYKNYGRIESAEIKKNTKKEEWLEFAKEIIKDYEEHMRSLENTGSVILPEGELERIEGVLQFTILLIIGFRNYQIFIRELEDAYGKILENQSKFISFIAQSEKTIN